MPRKRVRSMMLVVFLSYCVTLATAAHAIASTTAIVSSDQQEDGFRNKKSWYTRYPRYPSYCSTNDEMAKRAIPPLLPLPDIEGRSNSSNSTRLVHVTTVIRHGARTPYLGKGDSYTCWKGFWDNPATGIWDCDLTTLMALPTAKQLAHQEDNKDDNDGAYSNDEIMFLFEKKYDAPTTLHSSSSSSSKQKAEYAIRNELGGTCKVGQLLMRGYEQQLANGRHLRDAYCYNDGSADSLDHNDPRMRLLDLSGPKGDNANHILPLLSQQIYYRSDDDQRTLLSGQALLRGLLGKELLVKQQQQHSNEAMLTSLQPMPTITIPLHTADKARDILACNPALCPRLVDLAQEAKNTKEFQSFNSSSDIMELRTLLVNELGWDIDHGTSYDCIMTTMCTDRPLPDLINDYNPPANSSNDAATKHRGKNNLLEQIYNFSIQQRVPVYLHNNAAYSKLGMSPMWKEIMGNIYPIVHPDLKAHNSSRINNEKKRPPKLALFSGHDTTIIPLMATLGERVWNVTDWPPYASMMIIEVHEIIDASKIDQNIYETNFAFRLLYNGNVMTPLVDGCPAGADLCDFKILESLVDPLLLTDSWQCDVDSSLQESSTNSLIGPQPVSDDWAEKIWIDVWSSHIEGLWNIVVLIVISAAAGSIATLYLTGNAQQLRHFFSKMVGIDSISNNSNVHSGDEEVDELVLACRSTFDPSKATPIRYGSTSME